jgi:hypothetical protein
VEVIEREMDEVMGWGGGNGVRTVVSSDSRTPRLCSFNYNYKTSFFRPMTGLKMKYPKAEQLLQTELTISGFPKYFPLNREAWMSLSSG